MENSDIIYVDSNKKYASELLSFLIFKEFNVKYCPSIKDAYVEYSNNKVKLIIIDASIENDNSLSFIKKIKQNNEKIKVLLLSSNPSQDLLIKTIPLKIENLIIKNNSFEKIAKEIEKLNISKPKDLNDKKRDIFDIGNSFFYDRNSSHIIHEQNIIHLTTQENTLIEELIKAQGNFISYKQLQSCITKSTPASIDTLRTVIRKIRKKTYDDIIQNQSGNGYKINYLDALEVNIKNNIDKSIQIAKKILILNGNKKTNDLLKYQLEKFGFICDSAYTINEAKESFKSEDYDYLISALSLPDGDGIDFIREKKEYKVKTIIVSASSDIYYKEYLYFKGIIDYILDINDHKYLALTIYQTIFKIENNIKYNNILVIEKSKRICEQIKDILLPRNYNLTTVNSIKQAYELINTKSFNLIILDINYKECFELIQDVKSQINKHLPFIVLTDTHRTYETVRESYKNGANECLRKPIFAEEFTLKIDQLIENSKLVGEVLEQKELLDSYKDIVDNSMIISKTDIKGNITYVNEMFTKISGYTKEELIGKNHNIIRHPDSRKETFKDMWKTIKEDKKVWHGIIKNKAKNGNDYVVKTSIMPIVETNGNIKEFIALRNDITNIYRGENSEQ